MFDYRELITPIENPALRQWQVAFDHKHRGRIFKFVEAATWQEAESAAQKVLGIKAEDILTTMTYEQAYREA